LIDCGQKWKFLINYCSLSYVFFILQHNSFVTKLTQQAVVRSVTLKGKVR